MSARGPVFVVMARAPEGPRAPKSRLASVVPDEGDRRRLYSAFLTDVANRCRTVDDVALRVAYAPDGGTAGFDRAGIAPAELLPQRGADLGARERGVFEDLFDARFSPVVMIGSDLPTLPHTVIDAALERLRSDPGQVVLGPAEDGGYYLMGLVRGPEQATVPDLFSDIRWSTAWTLADTEAAANRARLTVTRLVSWYDVDDEVGFTRLRQDLATPEGARLAPATKAVLDLLKI